MTNQNPIYWQDEILQIMYWMRGEGIGEVVSLEQINRFLNMDNKLLKESVNRLVQLGYLKFVNDHQQVLLTAQGLSEGKRRFLDEFESYLGHESHLVCDDPDCECHDPDWVGVCKHLSDGNAKW